MEGAMNENATAEQSSSWSAGVAAAVTFVITVVIARALLETLSEPWQRVAVALLPIIPFCWLLVMIVRGVRTADELERRIQLEALAVAFPLTLVLLLTLGMLELAVGLPAEDFSYRHLWAVLPVLYFIGLALARKRYA
jgi:hypothetical protein